MFAVPTLFTRHAESVVNAKPGRRAEKHTAIISLSRRGHRQRTELAAWYPGYVAAKGWQSLTVFISPFHRTRATAEPVIAALLKRGIRVRDITDNLLREVNSGFYAGKKPYTIAVEEQQRQQANRDRCHQWIIPPGGESLAQATDRAALFRLKWHNRITTDAVAIFGHGLQGRMQLVEYFDHEWDWYYDHPNLPNASTRLLENGVDHGFVFTPAAASTQPVLTDVSTQH